MKKEYILKHKNIPVLTFFMDDENYTFQDLGDILRVERLPYGIIDKNSRGRNAALLNTWIQGRGLPESRKDKLSIKEQFKVNELKTLTIQAHGLNLTDHYWLHKIDENLKWEEVNHFDNTFDEVKPGKELIPGIDESVNRNSPNLCVDGSIEKRWIIKYPAACLRRQASSGVFRSPEELQSRFNTFITAPRGGVLNPSARIKNGERYLIKGSRYRRMQEPFNERIASMIMGLCNIYHVNYELKRTKENIPYSECKCMCSREIEYLNAWWVMNNKDYEAHNLHSGYLDICRNNGIKDAKERIDEMMAIDFLIGNEDRHQGNFGILRNADTLEWLGIAPIFDNGNSLFFDYENEDMDHCDADSFGKAFRDKNSLNLELIDYPQWYDPNKGNNIVDIVALGLKDNEKLKSSRIDKVVKITRERINTFEKSIAQKK